MRNSRPFIPGLVLAIPFLLPGDAASSVWFADPGESEIVQVTSDGTFATKVLTGLYAPTAIAIDNARQKLLWSQMDDGIYRADLDGSNLTEVVPTAAQATALSLDASSLYWTDRADGSVSSMPLDGGVVTVRASGSSSPNSIAIDSAGIYWADDIDNAIRFVPISGGAALVLATPDAPMGVAVDATHIYWGIDGAIQRAPIGGGPVSNLLTGIGRPLSLSLDSNAAVIYWSEEDSHEIQRVNLDGSGRTHFSENDSNPVGVAIAADPGFAVAPDECLATKLAALAKHQSALLRCDAKEAAGDVFTDINLCIQRADARLENVLLKAGSCSGDGPLCREIGHDCSFTLRFVLPDYSSRCESKRLKAAAKKTSGLLRCARDSAAEGTAIDLADCVASANARFLSSFDSVTGCTGDGNAEFYGKVIETECASPIVVLDASANVIELCRYP